MLRLLVYALGGGAGHLVRAVALGRAALRRGHAVEVLANSPHAEALGSALAEELPEPAGRVRALDPGLGRDAVAQEVRGWLLGALARTDRPAAVVVDTFPRGLGGELAELLPELPAARILVHRDLAPAYVERADLPRFVRACFDGVLIPGEVEAPLAHLPRAVEVPPFLIRDADELLEREAARAALGAPAGDPRPLVLVAAAGRAEEAEELRGLAVRLERAVAASACIVFTSPASRFPLLPLLPGADLLIASAGCNTVREARAAGVPLIAIPRQRLYDRQARRLVSGELAATADDALVQAVAFLEDAGATARRPRAAYRNGAHEAVAHLEALARRRCPA